jgi:hypothetical protein
MKDDSLSSRYEVIKIDSMWKTQNEKANFDVVNTNLTGGKLYHVLNTVNLPGEFVGAVRSCAESSSDLKMFNVLSLRDLFSNNTEPGVLQKVIQQLAKCLDAIYGLGHLNHSEPAFHVYRKRILPEVMEILTPWGLPQIQPVEPDQEISKLTPDFRAIGMPEHEEYCLRLLEIAPDVDNINRCALLFESEDYYGKTFHSNCIYNSHGWRESFIKQGLSQGQKVKVSGIIQRGYFFQIFEEIINLNIIAGLSPASRREKDERVQEINKINAEQKEKQKMEAFIIQTHLSFSTGSPPILKHVWNPLYLLDRFSTENDLLLKEVTGPAHGDLNLDNILIYLEDENNQRRVEHSNDEPEVRLIDLASFATDYPLSFDYVKLEVEIKNHILARPGFLNLGDDFSNWEDRGKFVDFVFQFEKKIWESNEQNDWQERTDEWTEDIKLYLKIIKEIRMLGQARYQSNVVDTSLLYQQQLFFYSLRTMTYRKISKWGKLWAFLAAIVAADHLDLA